MTVLERRIVEYFDLEMEIGRCAQQRGKWGRDQECYLRKTVFELEQKKSDCKHHIRLVAQELKRERER